MQLPSTWEGVEEGQLQALWEAGGEALHVQLGGVPPLWLQKHLQHTDPGEPHLTETTTLEAPPPPPLPPAPGRD